MAVGDINFTLGSPRLESGRTRNSAMQISTHVYRTPDTQSGGDMLFSVGVLNLTANEGRVVEALANRLQRMRETGETEVVINLTVPGKLTAAQLVSSGAAVGRPPVAVDTALEAYQRMRAGESKPARGIDRKIDEPKLPTQGDRFSGIEFDET